LKPRDQVCLREQWMLFLVLTKSYPNLVGHVCIGGPLWSHCVVVLVVAAVVVVGCCYPNVNATARKCCGLKGQGGCLSFPKDLQATPPSPTTNQWRRGNENP
jgi:hypothetical protein